jgi:hypothetical protein
VKNFETTQKEIAAYLNRCGYKSTCRFDLPRTFVFEVPDNFVPPTRSTVNKALISRAITYRKAKQAQPAPVPAPTIAAPAPVELPKFEVVQEVTVPAPKPKVARAPRPELIPYNEVSKHSPFAGLADLLKARE